LRVGFNGFVPAGRELTVTARLGKAAPVKTVVSPSRAAGLTMDVPVAMGTEPGPLTLELAYDAPVSPQQAGVSADPRLIALGLTSLQWIDATSAPDH
jgi:phosphoglycerol transferase